MKKVLIDPGHGGIDGGAPGLFDDHEARINLVTSLFLQAELAQHYIVGMTRIDDRAVSLGGRVQAIYTHKPDAFVSLHCNSFHNEDANGFEVFYGDDYDKPLAIEILNRFILNFPNMKNRGIKEDEEWLGHKLAVLKDVPTPCVLVEMGFISNPSDYMYLMQHGFMAKTIADGVKSFLGYYEREIDGHPV